MLDIHNGHIRTILVTRHEQLVRDQQLHRLAAGARSAGTHEVPPRRRALARFRASPATR